MGIPHVVTIKHDPESHEYDCHDDCGASIACPGVTDSCRCWWECDTCRAAMKPLEGPALDEYEELLWENGEAHGEEHQHIDGMWMTPSGDCLALQLETDACRLVEELPDGDHPVDLDCDEGFVYITAISPAKSGG